MIPDSPSWRKTSPICSGEGVRGASVLPFYLRMCMCVGLRQNRAAEMRQALQIFVGWLTAPSPCQAPTAETTKRRIRLALGAPNLLPPSPPSMPPSLFSFSFLASWRGVYFGRGLTRFGNICIHSWFYQSVFIPLQSDAEVTGREGNREHGTWKHHRRVR